MAGPYTPRRSSVSRGHGSDRDTAPVAFDSSVPEGVDPEANWRMANSSKFRRTGSTSAERAGNAPGYTPGYGRSSTQNRPMGFTADWAGQFKPQIQIPKAGEQTPSPSGTGMASSVTPAPSLPPAANPTTPIPPAAQPAPSIPRTAAMPNITTQAGTQGSVRQVTGLPAGQRASASFVPGQISPANLAKRTRPPIDPLA